MQPRNNLSHISNIWIATTIFVMIMGLIACGSGGGGAGNGQSILYRGIILNENMEPANDVGIYVYETGESSSSDENGEFSIESYSHFSSVGFFAQAQSFSNTVRIENIPDNATYLDLVLIYDTSGKLSLFSAEIKTSPLEEEEEPPTIEPTPNPLDPNPPKTTPTAKPGNFDANGNTQAFGIPTGLSGNINKGKRVWSGTCSSCHSREKSGKSFGSISGALKRIPNMQFLSISRQEVADLTAYLNRSRR